MLFHYIGGMSVLIEPTTPEFQVILGLTIATIVLKFGLAAYFLRNILLARKMRMDGSRDVPATSFMWAVFWFMLFMGIERIFLIYFDYLTGFDVNEYLVPDPNARLIYWRLGMFFANVGQALLYVIADLKVFGNKFRGIPGIVVLFKGSLFLFFPIQTLGDLTLLGTIDTIIGVPIHATFPILFAWLAYKTPGIRRTALIIAGGVMFFALGALFVPWVSFTIMLVDTYGTQVFLILTAVNVILKVVGLVMIAYGSSKLRL